MTRTPTLTPADMTAEEVKAALFGPVGKGNKFHAIKTTVDGQEFDSKAEASWFMGLIQREKAGHIRNLQRQVKYPLAANGIHIADYIADAVYEQSKGAIWQTIVSDMKGVVTPVFRLKAKLFAANYGFPIFCVDSKGRGQYIPRLPKPRAARNPRKETQS